MATDASVTKDESQAVERIRSGQHYHPFVDILETPEELTLIVDMPGVKSEAIDIDFEDGVLLIEGKVEPRYGDGTNFLLQEYGIGDFHRSFRVHEQIDSGRIHADYADGVLVVHLPKAESAKPRKIKVNAAS